MSEDKVTVIAPERVELSYELAGIGSRFLANLIDTLLQVLAIALIVGIFLILGLGGVLKNIFAVRYAHWMVALMILAGFSILWGYYIYFEVMFNGQSPGKKLIRIRVLRDGGFPITVTEAMIRNLMRFVDFLPAYYALGVIVMFFNRQYKRLGDFAAGTIVVKERRFSLPRVTVSGEKSCDLHIDIRPLTEEDYTLISEYMSRRSQFDLKTREGFSRKLSLPFMKKLGLDGLPSQVESHEDFLEALATRYREARKAR